MPFTTSVHQVDPTLFASVVAALNISWLIATTVDGLMVPSRHLLCVSPMCPVMSHVSSSSLPVLAFLFSVTSPLLFRSLRNFRARHDSDGDDSNRKPSDINGAVVFRENRLKECPFMLSDDQIQQFLDDGVIVVPVLSEDEVQRSRIGFHKDLKRLGCDPENLSSTASALSGISSTGGAGGILDIFYSEWKLSVNEHPHVVAAFVQLFRATYASWRDDNSSLWYHPFGQFQAENVFMYIDRCCFRVSQQTFIRECLLSFCCRSPMLYLDFGVGRRRKLSRGLLLLT